MTDDEFLELVSEELKICITKEEISTYRKGIPVIAEKLKDELDKFTILKRICIDGIECEHCKKLGIYGACSEGNKTCEEIRTEVVDQILGAKKNKNLNPDYLNGGW